MTEQEIYEWNESLKYKYFWVRVLHVPISVLPHVKGAVYKAFGKILKTAPVFGDPIAPDLWTIRFDLVPSARVNYKQNMIIELGNDGYVDLEVAGADSLWCKNCRSYFHDESDPNCAANVRMGTAVSQKDTYKDAVLQEKDKGKDEGKAKVGEREKEEREDGEKREKDQFSKQKEDDSQGKGKRSKQLKERGTRRARWRVKGRSRKEAATGDGKGKKGDQQAAGAKGDGEKDPKRTEGSQKEREREGEGNQDEGKLQEKEMMQGVEYRLKKSITVVEVVAAGTEASKLITQGRQALDQFALKQLEEIMEATRKKGEVKTEVSEESIDSNIQKLREALAAEERKKEEVSRRREQEQRRGQRVKEIRQVIGTEVSEQTDMSQTLAHIVTYLTFLEEKIDRQQNQLDEITVGLRTIANIVKGKNQIQGGEEQEEKKEKKEVKKLMGEAMKSAGPMIKTNGNGNGSNRNGSNGNGSSPPFTPHSSKSTPKETPEKISVELEKPKKKEKVKMKLPFTFCNKKEESLLLWIAEIQTYVSTAPIEPESQVAFTTSCMGGEAKQWVLAEANAAGFEDIGEWAKTLTLKQFLAKTRDRFLDKTTTDKAFDQLTSIGQKHWTSVEALSREVDRLLQVPGLNLQDSQVLYIYSRALPEPIRGHLVIEAKSGKYNYRQFRDLALQREQITSQVKNSYAAVVKSGGG
ncbi:hypothetical protein CBR_g49603 [Chara braunii]|uniref:Retrotransposon gag domain-containing protein n=1 Tax=Chara braunii TaxID=69332 RepID=A0A388M5B6_CHABU|nr:hypothetical protein CBR_g49603 [Chara braunii]|eukprot:GBG89751.1 hypothetical protein CBR_g49603 [Chara braunii]